MKATQKGEAAWLRTLVVAFVIQVCVNVGAVVASALVSIAAYQRAAASEVRIAALDVELRAWVLIDARKAVERMVKEELDRHESNESREQD